MTRDLDGTQAFGEVEAALAAFDGSTFHQVVLEGPDHRVTACNAAVRALAGRPLLGLRAVDALGDLFDAAWQQRVAACLRDGTPYVHHEGRFAMSGPGGRRREVVATISLLPWTGAGGEVRGVIATALDVTAQVTRRREQQRQEVAERQLTGTRDTVAALQDSLLPTELPVLPGLDVSAHYLLADDDTSAGGDWFDTVVLADGRVALVVGDVVGHGVAASAVMGQLRAVLQSRLMTGAPLPEVLADLDRFAALRPESSSATVCLAVVDPGTGAIDYATAGHPPPLVLSPGGQTRFLPGSGGPTLGAGGAERATEAFPVRCERLGPDELLLLYTDGLVERPGRNYASSTIEIAQVALDAALDRGRSATSFRRTTERVCRLGLEVLTRTTGYQDDITMLVAQRVPVVTPLHLRLAADRVAVAAVRPRLAEWLSALDVRALDEVAVQHAVGEVVTNAVEHAYAGRGDGQLRVRAAVDRCGDLVATVADDGTWREPAHEASARGHGLAMARELADDLRVETTGAGTTVTLRRRLTRPAQLSAGTREPRPLRLADPRAPMRCVYDAPEATMTVTGALDHGDVDELRVQLRRAGLGGVRPLTLDLAGVSHLGSAAVQVLTEVARDWPPGGLRVHAPAGSVAQHVLELVRLPYEQG